MSGTKFTYEKNNFSIDLKIGMGSSENILEKKIARRSSFGFSRHPNKRYEQRRILWHEIDGDARIQFLVANSRPTIWGFVRSSIHPLKSKSVGMHVLPEDVHTDDLSTFFKHLLTMK